MRRLLFASFCLLLAALMLAPQHALAQSGATTGIIRGTVTDPTGASVAGASVTVRQRETGFTRTLSTSSSGVFVATLLPVGTYTVSASSAGLVDATEEDVGLRLGETIRVQLALQAVELAAIEVIGETPLVDVSDVTGAKRISAEAVAGLPNNGRNYLDFTTLTPGVSIVQGPDGDELTIGGQRGIFNNITVDGADFNNPFFGEQRGGQRPAFTFNLDAVQEIVVVNGGATAEFGRSAGGFVNVITKSGTNEMKGSLHYFGQFDEISADFARGGGNPDFRQHQVGATLGGPIVRDKAFFFFAYDQQVFDQTKQTNRLPSITNLADFNTLVAWTDTAFGGALAGDFGPIDRTNDAEAFLAKFDFRLSGSDNLSLKYNYTHSVQRNGTFDVDLWGRSANGLETDRSHAVNGALTSQLSSTVSNEFRFQFSREDRDRPYDGPTFPSGRPFPDVAIGEGIRFGLPFFLPILDFDDRIQILDNISIASGNHLFKFGGEWNRTRTNQTFIGFANARMIFADVASFLDYTENGPDPAFAGAGGHPGNLLYLQLAPVPPFTDINEVGQQNLVQNEYAAFIQDTWTPNEKVTLNLGLRWEAQVQPDVLTDPSDVFFAPFIGDPAFPSDGTIPSNYSMFQPRFGLAYDASGDGSSVLRINGGLFYARLPGLILAGVRTTNGSIGQNLVAIGGLFGDLPRFDELLDTQGIFPAFPGVTVADRGLTNPRTWTGSIAYEKLLNPQLAGSITYQASRTDNLFRFVDRNDAVFGSPFGSGLEFVPGDGSTGNGILGLTSTESNAFSIYHGVTLGLKGDYDAVQFDLNYTLSSDRSDDDNERDPFLFRYVQADRLDAEFGFSDRDQRHRFNAWLLIKTPGNLVFNNRITAQSAQPTSESCVGNQPSGIRAGTIFGTNAFVPDDDRLCDDGTIIQRNTIRKDNELFSWDVRISRPFQVGRGTFEPIVEIFNLFNTDNFQDPSATSLLFNFDGTIQSGLGNPRRMQVGARWRF